MRFNRRIAVVSTATAAALLSVLILHGTAQAGSSTKVEVAGDWDGDGDDTPGVFDSRTGTWYLWNRYANGPADLTFTYGNAFEDGWPIVGDWDGDGVDTPGLVRGLGDPARTPVWLLRDSNTSGAANRTFIYGFWDGWPLAGDWDGNGTDTPGLVHRPSITWFLRNSNTAGVADLTFIYGFSDGWPLAGDWDGNGTDTPGLVYRPSATWFLRNSNTSGTGTVPLFAYGAGTQGGQLPVSGDWDGIGPDTPGVVDRQPFPDPTVWMLRNRNNAGVAEVTFYYSWDPLTRVPVGSYVPGPQPNATGPSVSQPTPPTKPTAPPRPVSTSSPPQSRRSWSALPARTLASMGDAPAGSSPALEPPGTLMTPDAAGAGMNPASDGNGGLLPATPDVDTSALVLATVGIAAAVATATVAVQLRRRFRRDWRPDPEGEAPPVTASAMPATGVPMDVYRVDEALRGLATALAGQPRDLPDPIGAIVERGDIHLFLSEECPMPPIPWHSRGDRWVLPWDALTDPPGERAAPLPALAAIGSDLSTHVLLDLERLGCLMVTGNRARRNDLLRYMAAGLALNPWSDDVEILLSGFDQGETELLVGLNPARLRPAPLEAAISELGQRVHTTAMALASSGVADTLGGRVAQSTAGTWITQILIVADASTDTLAALSGLLADLEGAARRGVGLVVATSADVAPQSRWTITAMGSGALQLPPTLPQMPLTAAGLPLAELEKVTGAVVA